MKNWRRKKTARVDDAGAVVRDENSRRSPSRSEPSLGFVAGGQSCFEDRRILFLGEVRPLGHDLPVILPISGRRSKSITVGIRCMGAVFDGTTLSSVSPVGLFTSRRRPA